MSALCILAQYEMTRHGHRRLAWLGQGIDVGVFCHSVMDNYRMDRTTIKGLTPIHPNRQKCQSQRAPTLRREQELLSLAISSKRRKIKMKGKTVHRRIIIKRHYSSEGFDFLYDIKFTKLPIEDFARFDESVLATTAMHTHDYLLELLTEIFGEERAKQFLKDAMRGDTVKEMMPTQTDTKLLDKLKTSSAKVDETA